MKIILFAALVALAMTASSDWSTCWECVVNGFEWNTDCQDYDTGSGYTTLSYCDIDWTSTSFYGVVISYYGEVEGQEPITMTLGANEYDYSYFTCYPYQDDGTTEDDATCTITMDAVCSDCYAYWYATTSSDYWYEADAMSVADGETWCWLNSQYYAYMYGFNAGSASGDIVVSYQSAQTMFMGVFGLLATLLYFAF